MPEHKARDLRASFAWAGFEQAIIYYDRRRRVSSGKTNWSLARLLNTGYDTFRRQLGGASPGWSRLWA